MEIRTANKWNLSTDEDCNINEEIDGIVCALILEGHHAKTIREALLCKAEAMLQEYHIKEGGGE